MANLFFDTEGISKYATDLVEKSTELGTLLTSMESTIESISGSWSGYDAENFISNASCYLNNLKAIQDALDNFANIVNECSKTYEERVAAAAAYLG